MRYFASLLVLIVPVITCTAFGQSGVGALAGPASAPRGVWVPPNAGDERLVDFDAATPAPVNPFAIETNPLQRVPRTAASTADPNFRKLTISEVPFQPWARALYLYRQENQLEPHTRCKPSGGPRPFLTPYGVEFLELRDLQRIVIVDIGGPHTIRVIYTDGRPHPADLPPGYLGHSTGKWEGKTLLVDTVGFNERFWIDRFGLPHTHLLHVTERFTRIDDTTLKYEVTIDDRGAYTAPWTSGVLLRWNPNQDLFEYVCQDNNLAPEMMLGTSESMNRTSVIVP
ncbi:MAG TPA: hypothetical protein VFR05_10195 [Terriglobia bacterium]|nr:hypothetical protein [Terriglobia bacterium]